MKYIYFFLCLLNFLQAIPYHNKEFEFTNDPIDVVIPCTDKDFESLELCIEGIKKNCINLGKIFVVSKNKITDKAEWFDETKYPFTFDEVIQSLSKCDPNKIKTNCIKSRAGWYFQQLLKLYSPIVIPNISPNVLVLDSDIIFIKPTYFLNKYNAGMYNLLDEYNRAYFEHAKRLIPDFIHVIRGGSGIAHHMLFQRCVITELFKEVERKHNTLFWKAFCECVDFDNVNFSGASEYELYINYLFSHNKYPSIRKLRYGQARNIYVLNRLRGSLFDYIGYHHYLRTN